MSLLSELIEEELQARATDHHVLKAYMGWTDRELQSFLHDDRKLLLKEVERMAVFFDVSWQFIFNLSRRGAVVASVGCQKE